MRATLIYILAGALVSSPTYADSSARILAARQAEQEIAELDSPYISVNVPPGTRNPGYAAHYMAQAAIVAVAVAKAKHKIEEERGSKFTPEETAELVAVTATQMVTNLQTSATVLALHQTNRVMAPVTQRLLRPSEASAALKLIKLTIARQLATSAGIGASSLVSELFYRSIKKLPIEDQEKGQNLILALYHAAKADGGVAGKAAALADEGRVMGQILANMGDIAILNQDERNMWVYDTWRNDLATGKFVTGTAAMSLGATAGGAIGSVVPVVGTGFGSMIGGTAGMMVAIGVIPDEQTAKITDAMMNARKTVLFNRLKSCMERAENTYHLSESASFNRTHNIGDNDLLRPLNACEKLREGYLTIVMDQTKNVYSQMTILRNRITAALKEKPDADIHAMKNDLLKAGFRLHQLTGDAAEFYAAQKQAFDGLLFKFKNTATLNFLGQEASRLNKVAIQLKTTLNRLPEDHDATLSVFTSSNEGFRENDWLGGSTETAPPVDSADAPSSDH